MAQYDYTDVELNTSSGSLTLLDETLIPDENPLQNRPTNPVPFQLRASTPLTQFTNSLNNSTTKFRQLNLNSTHIAPNPVVIKNCINCGSPAPSTHLLNNPCCFFKNFCRTCYLGQFLSRQTLQITLPTVIYCINCSNLIENPLNISDINALITIQNSITHAGQRTNAQT